MLIFKNKFHLSVMKLTLNTFKVQIDTFINSLSFISWISEVAAKRKLMILVRAFVSLSCYVSYSYEVCIYLHSPKTSTEFLAKFTWRIFFPHAPADSHNSYWAFLQTVE